MMKDSHLEWEGVWFFLGPGDRDRTILPLWAMGVAGVGGVGWQSQSARAQSGELEQGERDKGCGRWGT